MKSGWEERPLGEACDFIGRGVSPKYVQTKGLCVLNQKCVRDHKVDYSLARLHDHKAKSVGEDKIIRVGDVLVNSTGTGTLGRVAQILDTPPSKTTVDGHVSIVRPKAGLFFEPFFGYAMIAIEDQIALMGEGCGGQTELSRTTLRDKFNIRYPKSLPEQKYIVSVLDKAYAAIVTAKENAEKNLRNGGELFETYIEDLFGKKGKNWDAKKLGSLCEITDGTHFSPKNSDSGDFMYITAKNIKPYRIDLKKISYVSKAEHKKIYATCQAKKGDILYIKDGATAGIAAINSFDEEFSMLSSVALLKPNAEIMNTFLVHYMNSRLGRKNFLGYLDGAAITRLTLTKLNSVEIPLPPMIEQRKFVAILDALLEKTGKLNATYSAKIEDLDDLKKSLLQKAFAGELREAQV